MARNMMKSTNPAFRTDAFRGLPRVGGTEAMTLHGAINKTVVLFVLLMITAGWVWTRYTAGGPAAVQPFMIGGLIGGLAFAFATIFKPNWAPVTAPLYAILEGLVVGSISTFYNAQAHGVVIQAVALTFGVMAVMLFLYRARIIKVTEKFRMGLSAAIGGIFLFYLVAWIVQLCGVDTSMLFGGGTLGIGISIVICAIAALSLVLDFDMMQRASVAGAPKYMEWYTGFALMVTLVWLYMEILRLAGNMRQ